jgi:Fe-S oxidoreductase
MDQKTLRQWESRCIQEEPPFCQAACPLNVDARAFCGRLAQGDADGARKVIERSLPLPEVLGRVCEAPCEAVCKRREAGDAVAIGALERYAVATGRPGPKPMRLPGKKSAALIIGSGLAALVCAWDLLKKGHAVTLATCGEPLFGPLALLPEETLPPQAIARELSTLRGLGLALDETPCDPAELLARGLPTFLEWTAQALAGTPFPGRDTVDPVTLAAPDGFAAGVFLGGWPDPSGVFRAIDAAADGRRAASSLDRHMTGVSLTASREKEGVTQTRLFTSLAGVAPLPRVFAAGAKPDAAQATQEAARCLDCQCLECVRACDYLEKHKAYPKTYARQIYNNAAIVKGQHMANKLVNSCSLCGLCAKVCPEGFDMAGLCLEARRDMTARGAMPQSAHEFALEDMDAANGAAYALTRPDPTSATAAYVFFPGCQLSASHPHHVREAYGTLRRRLTGGVGIMLRCCGVPAHWAGETERFRQSAREFAAQWESLGKPKVIAACSGCLEVFRQEEFRAAAPGLEAVSLWEIYADLPLPARGLLPRPHVSLHDPCTARDDPGFHKAVRAILNRLGVPFLELPRSGEFSECCGFGGLMSQVDRPLAETVARRLASESEHDYIAACAMCRDRIFAAGKRCLHLLDLLYPSPCADPAGQPGPGYSGRQEARAELRATLLREIWGESAPEPAHQPGFAASTEVQALLEDRRILIADLRDALGASLATGRFLRDAESGRILVSHRPRRVTFWALFEPDGDGWRLVNAYSHRMIVPGAGGVDKQPESLAEQANRVDQTYLPESGAWRCAACDEAMAPAQAVVSYLGSVFTISLLTCPACGQTLVPEALALGRMAEVEQLLEDK